MKVVVLLLVGFLLFSTADGRPMQCPSKLHGGEIQQIGQLHAVFKELLYESKEDNSGSAYTCIFAFIAKCVCIELDREPLARKTIFVRTL